MIKSLIQHRLNFSTMDTLSTKMEYDKSEKINPAMRSGYEWKITYYPDYIGDQPHWGIYAVTLEQATLMIKKLLVKFALPYLDCLT